MTTDNRLRQALIRASRRRALEDRWRLSPASASSVGLPLALAAAGLLLGWWTTRRTGRLAAGALVLGGCVWLALGRSKGADIRRAPAQEFISDSDWEVPPVDQASSQSFPASDPPAYNP